jgi:hypothetical protein
MQQITRLAFGAALCISLVAIWDQQAVYAEPPDICDTAAFKNIDPEASKPLKAVTLPPAPGSCKPKESHGFPIPDPKCSPGAINPTLTIEILKTKGFTTKCVRDQSTSAAQKAKAYVWYGITKPKKNSGPTQTCELDHIISLELGGSDGLENIWPQCGPPGVVIGKRFFKQKDAVEDFLAAQVRAGKISLDDAQHGISEDWTQFLDAAKKAAPKKRRK